MTRRKLNIHTLALWAALPMARTAQVESRLQMILKPQQNRRALTRCTVIGFLVAAALGVSTLAALKPEARAQTMTHAATPTSWKQTLPNGATVEVLGVSEVPPAPVRWWKPDGSPLALEPCDSDAEMRGTNTGPMRQIVLRLTPPPSVAAASLNTNFDSSATAGARFSSGQQASHHRQLLPGIELLGVGFGDLPAAPPAIRIRYGVAAGPWETLDTIGESPAFSPMKSVNLPYQHTQVNVIFSRASEIDGNVAVTVTNTLPDTLATWRVLAVDTSGKVYTSSAGGRLGGKVQQETCVFAGLTRKRVRAFQFQARPYEWAEFKGIALTPHKQ